MHKINTGRRLSGPFFTLVCSGSIFVADEILRLDQFFSTFYTPRGDVILTWAYLTGALGIASLVVTAAFAVAACATRRWHHRRLIGWVSHLLPAVSFAALGTVFLHSLRLLAVAYVPAARRVPPDLWLVWAAVASLLLYIFRSASIRTWLADIETPLRVMGTAVLVASVGLLSWSAADAFVARRGATGPVNAVDRPNVILVVLDSLTARDMALYGYHLPTTPTLARLASEWTVYEQAHANSTSTLASRAAILTGRYPYFNFWHRYGDLARDGQGWTALPKVLKQAGYETVQIDYAYHPAIHHMQWYYDRTYMPSDAYLRWSGWLTNPVRHLPTRAQMLLFFWAQEYLSGDHKLLVGEFNPIRDLEWEQAKQVVAQPHERPLFLHLNADRPHYPYVSELGGVFLPVSEGLSDEGSQNQYLDKPYEPKDQPMIDRLRLRYDETILRADALLGELISTLKAREMYDNSLIIVTADHGENFSKGNQGHSTYLMGAAEHHIPLLVKFPNQREGQRVSAIVQQVDILPTIMQLLGVSHDGLVDGFSLLSIPGADTRIAYTYRLNEGSRTGPYALAAMYQRFKLFSSEGATFLFDLRDDPNEVQNRLASDISVAVALQRALDQYAQRQDQQRRFGAIAEAPSVLATIDPPSGTPVPLRLVTSAQLDWANSDTSFGPPWQDGRLRFAGESRRSYAPVPVAEGTSHLLLQFRAAPSASVVTYVEALDEKGARLDFRAVIADARLAAQGRWHILVPLPAGTRQMTLAFKSAYADDVTEIWDLRVHQILIANSSAAGRGFPMEQRESGVPISPGHQPPSLRRRGTAELHLDPDHTGHHSLLGAIRRGYGCRRSELCRYPG